MLYCRTLLELTLLRFKIVFETRCIPNLLLYTKKYPPRQTAYVLTTTLRFLSLSQTQPIKIAPLDAYGTYIRRQTYRPTHRDPFLSTTHSPARMCLLRYSTVQYSREEDNKHPIFPPEYYSAHRTSIPTHARTHESILLSSLRPTRQVRGERRVRCLLQIACLARIKVRTSHCHCRDDRWPALPRINCLASKRGPGKAISAVERLQSMCESGGWLG
ncbi:hypothetical protein JOL62DRAFT_208196 [Phyllosticta paracitricarpa]|uniref:Uncharacterized protein n=1 Tax=Phyllosticta paracitricarpa TaxID=2016321 RepID=A0ABR1N445_9PEZI